MDTETEYTKDQLEFLQKIHDFMHGKMERVQLAELFHNFDKNPNNNRVVWGSKLLSGMGLWGCEENRNQMKSEVWLTEIGKKEPSVKAFLDKGKSTEKKAIKQEKTATRDRLFKNTISFLALTVSICALIVAICNIDSRGRLKTLEGMVDSLAHSHESTSKTLRDHLSSGTDTVIIRYDTVTLKKPK